jgi:hypothetical protein
VERAAVTLECLEFGEWSRVKLVVDRFEPILRFRQIHINLGP